MRTHTAAKMASFKVMVTPFDDEFHVVTTWTPKMTTHNVCFKQEVVRSTRIDDGGGSLLPPMDAKNRAFWKGLQEQAYLTTLTEEFKDMMALPEAPAARRRRRGGRRRTGSSRT